MQSALELIPRARQLPVYVYARAYQTGCAACWSKLGFRAWADQALLVKYTVVRVERVEMATVSALEPARRQTPAIDGPIFHPFNQTTDSRRSSAGRRKHRDRSNHSTDHSTTQPTRYYGTSNHR